MVYQISKRQGISDYLMEERFLEELSEYFTKMKFSLIKLTKEIFISLYEKVMIPILRENLQLQKIQALFRGKLLGSNLF